MHPRRQLHALRPVRLQRAWRIGEGLIDRANGPCVPAGGAGAARVFRAARTPAGAQGSPVSHMCDSTAMNRRITQRELRNESGRIMRALDRGETFTVTRNGVPVGELVPMKPRRFVAAQAVAEAFQRAPRIAPARFRLDVDAALSQDPTPRG